MRSFLLSCLCAASAALPLATWASPAGADPTKIRILPGVGGAESLFDHKLPASVEFEVDLRLADVHIDSTTEASGKLSVWPDVETPKAPVGPTPHCWSPPPDLEAPQHHRLAMTLSGTGADRVLSATVPPLQVAQPFCFKVEVYAAISAAELTVAAKEAATHLVHALSPEDGEPSAITCHSAATAGRFAAALQAALPVRRSKVAPDLSEAAKASLNLFRSAISNECTDAVVSAQKLARVNELVKERAVALDRVRAAIAGLHVPAQVNEPIVFVGGVAQPASALIGKPAAKRTPDDVKKNLDALRGAAAALLNAGGPAKAWGQLLDDLRGKLEAAKSDDEKKAAREWALGKAGDLGKAPLPSFLWRKSRAAPVLVPYLLSNAPEDVEDFLKNPDRLAPDDAVLQIRALEAIPDMPKTDGDDLEKLAVKVIELKDLTARWVAAHEPLADLTKAHDDAYTGLEGALVKALSSEQVRSLIRDAYVEVLAESKTVQGTTQNTNNYVSPDFGLLVALPSGGLAHDVWFLPYAGLNIYFAPVDRAIRMQDLVGTAGEQFGQRFSLTLGTTLSAPSLSGRTVNRPIGVGNYPMLAVGWRMSQFTRITAAAVFYDLSDQSPVSAGHTLFVAPSIGAALDADVVQLLTQKLKN